MMSREVLKDQKGAVGVEMYVPCCARSAWRSEIRR